MLRLAQTWDPIWHACRSKLGGMSGTARMFIPSVVLLVPRTKLQCLLLGLSESLHQFCHHDSPVTMRMSVLSHRPLLPLHPACSAAKQQALLLMQLGAPVTWVKLQQVQPSVIMALHVQWSVGSWQQRPRHQCRRQMQPEAPLQICVMCFTRRASTLCLSPRYRSCRPSSETLAARCASLGRLPQVQAWSSPTAAHTLQACMCKQNPI